jgi:hypothetical protein
LPYDTPFPISAYDIIPIVGAGLVGIGYLSQPVKKESDIKELS